MKSGLCWLTGSDILGRREMLHEEAIVSIVRRSGVGLLDLFPKYQVSSLWGVPASVGKVSNVSGKGRGFRVGEGIVTAFGLMITWGGCIM